MDVILIIGISVFMIWVWSFVSGLMDEIDSLRKNFVVAQTANETKLNVIRILQLQRRRLLAGASPVEVTEIAEAALTNDSRLLAYREFMVDDAHILASTLENIPSTLRNAS